MRQDADQTLLRLRLVAACPQGRAEEPFVAADGAFDLPPLPVEAPGEMPGHLPPILRTRRSVASARIQGDHRGADAQFLPAEPVVVFGVVGGVSQQAVETHAGGSLTQRFGELGRVVARTTADHDAGQKVTLRVADHGELRPFSAPERPVAVAIHVVGAGVSSLQARGVDGPLGVLPDQPERCCTLEAGSGKRVESPLFSSRCCA